jgi:hypothetical protein
MTPEGLVRTVEDFLAGAQEAMVLDDDGSVLFDLAQAKYSVSGERNKCLLHLWSAERNMVRRVLEVEIKNEVLRLSVQRLGQVHPSKLEICRQRDRRTPTAKRAARLTYQRRLQRAVERHFPTYAASRFSTSPDLERSFGPIYPRGVLRRAQSGCAVLGVNEQETQSSIDAALTFGILWLHACREAQVGKAHIEGLKLFVPRGKSALARERIAHLNRTAAKWELYEMGEGEDAIREIDISDRGNVRTRLVRWTDETAARERFAAAIETVRELMPEVETVVLSPAEVGFRCHGLEFARAHLQHQPGSLRSVPEIVFGVGAEEEALSDASAGAFQQLVHRVGEVRHSEGPRDHVLWRLHPERWLESLILGCAEEVDERLDSDRLYSQVPAFSASDRAMIDVLTVTRNRRLAVVELKADEDIHLPLQGLDYWSRVAWHHARGEFQQFGYFPGQEFVEGATTSVSGGAGTACTSSDRYAAALPVTGDRMDGGGPR